MEVVQVKYSETRVLKMCEGVDLRLEEQIELNILNFIRTIYLNKLNFIDASFNSQYDGQLPMTFKKDSGQVMGLVTAKIDEKVHKYIFNDQGYELLDDLLMHSNE